MVEGWYGSGCSSCSSVCRKGQSHCSSRWPPRAPLFLQQTVDRQSCLVLCCTYTPQDSQGFDAKWRSRVSEYEASVATQLCNLKQQHEVQLTDLLVRCENERPSRPQHSAEILNGRKIEEVLVKQVRQISK